MTNDPDRVARLNVVNQDRLLGIVGMVVTHARRTTEVWDATLTAESTGKLMALFRCTQIILWPKP